ncbi:MAG: hypothetical protein ACXW0Z_12210 [Gemmatirosa sp.]
MRRGPTRALTVALLVAGAAGACRIEIGRGVGSGGTLAVGTWGGEGAAVVVGDTSVHVHVGCTTGDFPAPVRLSRDGSFDVAGRYQPRAFPVALGPHVPARFVGEVDGLTLTLTVAVDDTVEKRLRLYGPVAVRMGEAPRLGQCPICRAAPVARATQGFRFPRAARYSPP